MPRAGQKVEALTSRWVGTDNGAEVCEGPKQGRVYTIARSYRICGFRVVELIEVSNGYPYLASGFRPIIEKKTDISIFKEILAGNRQPEGVEA